MVRILSQSKIEIEPSTKPNKATIVEPLHCLLDQSTMWGWKAKHENAYAKAKQLLQTDYIFGHYNEP